MKASLSFVFLGVAIAAGAASAASDVPAFKEGSPVFANAMASGLIGGSVVPGLAATKRRRISASMSR